MEYSKKNVSVLLLHFPIVQKILNLEVLDVLKEKELTPYEFINTCNLGDKLRNSSEDKLVVKKYCPKNKNAVIFYNNIYNDHTCNEKDLSTLSMGNYFGKDIAGPVIIASTDDFGHIIDIIPGLIVDIGFQLGLKDMLSKYIEHLKNTD